MTLWPQQSVPAGPPHSNPPLPTPAPAPATLCDYARLVLTSPDPADKVRWTKAAVAARRDHGIPVKLPSQSGPAVLPQAPARPAVPHIVGPSEMPSLREYSSGLPTPEAACNARAVYVLHGLAHVELNAIDLAWDTAVRFGGGQPDEWYDDFLSIAADEARHFGWLCVRLRARGAHYGALQAHRVIWDAADGSRASRRERLAVGQLCQEARGLDAGPRLAERLVGYGDGQAGEVVRKIAEEEVRHVEIGVKWFLKECEREGCADSAIGIFHEIALRLSNMGAFAPPFNEERRRLAGLEPEWYLPVAEEMRRVRLLQRAEAEAEAEAEREAGGRAAG